ncbi:MAG TPA: 4Fe-4S dicluster domain-containing protein [Dissulfurispiraceae bacterium]|nr:4Fe-4S dicluster domain-containing protein [Dissulfurispiraceae bacterium]
MKWLPDAEAAVAKVPFFVRKRVKQRVEEEAARCGSPIVTLEHVDTCRNRFLNKMEDEVKGFRVEACFGTSGCPNRAVSDNAMAQRIEELAASKNIRQFLTEQVSGALKLHHEFQVVLADCTNACSRPQIADIGIIGACRPAMTDAECSTCGACVDACREGAIALADRVVYPEIDFAKCLACGKCMSVCPTGPLRRGTEGYRVLVGGKLGRHPQLGRELPRILTRDEALRVVDAALDFYRERSLAGERFGEVLGRGGYENFIDFLKKRGVLI